MKVREIISEVKIDVPNQMVSVQVPLKDLMVGGTVDSSNVVNPGKRAGEDGNYKWSPPLQQQLDTAKDAVGDSNEETNEFDAEVQSEIDAPVGSDDTGETDLQDLKAKVAALLSGME